MRVAPLNRTDLAILSTNGLIQFTDFRVGSIPLPSPTCVDCEAVGERYLVSGYGLENVEEGTTATELQFMRSDYISLEECQLAAPFLIPYFAFCGLGANGASACQGDSGSGLARFNIQTETWELIGLVFTGTNIQSGQLLCAAQAENSTQYDVFVSVLVTYQWLNASLFDDIGEPTATVRWEEPKLPWYEWVAPTVGGIIALIFIVLLICSCRKRSHTKSFAKKLQEDRRVSMIDPPAAPPSPAPPGVSLDSTTSELAQAASVNPKPTYAPTQEVPDWVL